MTTTVTVGFAGQSASLEPGRREIAGLLVPWGAVAASQGRRWRFLPGSLHWPTEVGRVKLNRDHNREAGAIGLALELVNRPDGLYGRFRIGRSPVGDEVLALAEDRVYDGFSVEVAFGDGDVYGQDPDDPSVTVVRRGSLIGVAATGTPAYDDARLESVAASRNGATVRLSDVYVEVELADRVRAHAERESVSFAELQRSALRAYVGAEPAPYTFDGRGEFSLCRDLWLCKRDGGTAAVDAQRRLDRFFAWRKDLDRRAERADFVLSTGNASQVIPPGYASEPFMSILVADRPLAAAATRVPLPAENPSTPFNLPGTVTAVGATADHVEGTNPAEGSLTIGSSTVSPGAVSGLFKITRELVDSANPAIDAIAVAAMRESYAEQTEAKVYAQLNGASGQGGTITSGFVPSGAQVRTSTGAALPADLRKALAAYFNARKIRPRSVVAASRAAVAEVLADGLDESTGDDTAMWRVQGATVNLSAAFTADTAGDADVFILSRNDLWAWESPTLTFRYDERSGPSYVEVALFGYFATRLLRPAGLAAIRHT